MIGWTYIAKRVLGVALAGAFLVEVPAAEIDCSSTPGCVAAVSSSLEGSSISRALFAALPTPVDAEQSAYLGIENDRESFKLSEVQADVLVVLVFDLYCHVCGQSAANMSRLEETLYGQSDDCRVRVIGLGRGDTQFEVETFARKFKLSFPVFSDRKHVLSDGLGARQTPSGYVFLRKAGGGFELADGFTGYLSNLKLEAFANRVGALCSKE